MDACYPVDAVGFRMPTHADTYTCAAAANRNSDESSVSIADDTASYPDGIGAG